MLLPFFESHDASISTVLSDNGREFCDQKDHHSHELFFQLEEIEHRTTKVRRPQGNGFVERLHRTLLDEHFRIQDHVKWYKALDEMQQNMDNDLVICNNKRPPPRAQHEGGDTLCHIRERAQHRTKRNEVMLRIDFQTSISRPLASPYFFSPHKAFSAVGGGLVIISR
ncbi:hypothetical protein HACA111877_17750 [Halomonas casei]